MPVVIDTNLTAIGYSGTEDLGYRYPRNMDMRPSGELHKRILTEVYQRALESSNEMQKRFSSWRSVDQTLTAYIRTDDAEKVVKNDDDRKPISVVVPYSYATMETILTYFVTAFLESPIFKYEGVSPKDTVGAFLLERIVEQQTLNFKAALNLHTQFRDSLSYGLGVVTPTWEKKWGWKTVPEKQGFMSQIFGRFIDMGVRKTSQETVLYEGNRLRNVDPYRFLPDPNVPISEVQLGEFVGWIEQTNYMKLLELEKNDPDIFNVKFCKGMGSMGGYSQFNKSRSETGRGIKYGGSTTPLGITTTPIDVIWMYITLIPKDKGLGTSEYPEKWLFGLAADKVVICAKPLKLNHNMYPVSVSAPDFDGYSATPVSRLELMAGMQGALDWLFNSHIANVRKAINDMLIVDPSLVNMADLQDPKPGKLIRMRRAAWGRGVENAVKQLQVNDITRQHIPDAAYIIDFMQRTSGAVDSLQGMARKTGERVTATEARDTRASALSRLTKAAKITSLQSLFDLGYMYASHTQQLMSKETYVKVEGQWAETLKAEYGDVTRLLVSPYNILIDQNIIIKDGSVAGGEYSESWVEIFRILAAQPMLFQSFDMVRIFEHMARIMGAKDINEFVLKRGAIPPVQIKSQSDEAVAKEAQAGNLVPMNTAAALGGGDYA